jgi:glycosyltransferase involved in cell wall biosynthesis
LAGLEKRLDVTNRDGVERAPLGEQPLVSIITPSYNQGRFIEETILSIKNQTYPNIEHIICDGGSTDETLDVIRRHEGTYNLRWVSEPDKGQADAINKGFDMAQGEIVTWINSDDIYVTRDAVRKIVDAFRSYPAADVVTGNGIYIDHQGRWLYTAPKWSKNRVTHKHLRRSNTLIQPSTFFRRHLLRDCRCDTKFYYAFDWDLFACMARRGNILPIDEFIAGFRVHPASKTSAVSTRRVAEKREITGRHIGRCSAQYLILTFYYLLFRASDLLPRPLRSATQKAIGKVSVAVNFLTLGRIATV